MQKTGIVVFLLIFLFRIDALLLAQPASSFYNHTVVAETIDDPEYIASVTDLNKAIETLTGKPVSAISFNGSVKQPAVYLCISRPGLLPASVNSQLENGTTEDFYISGNSNRLLIVATHPLGLSRGIYTYLDKLGFKWYFPGKDWEYIPAIKSITLSTEQFYTPSFLWRDFFGTGGLFRMMAIDKDEKVKSSWEEWKRRNRLGGSVKLSGHYWETFTIANRAELEKHPEYLAEVGGKRVAVTPGAKFCISNKGLQNLFISDRVKYLRNQLAQQKWASNKIVIPVDPSDGGGHCECDPCTRLGTASDRVFFLANLVAKAVQPVSKKAWVNLYAYNEHAAPPSLALESNVIVQIIPYAFQYVGTPEEMISKWKQKSKGLFLYDYYGIPDWLFDTPLTGRWSTDQLIKKLQYWHINGLKGFLLESSNSIGTTGMGLYLAARLGWDIKENPGKIINGYYEKMYGKNGALWMRRYYEKVNSGFKGIADIPYLYYVLKKARAGEVAGSNISKRVVKLEAYLHYVVLYYQWKQAKGQLAEVAWEKLMQYCWEIYPTLMVHTTRIAQLLLAGLSGNNPLINKWNLYEKNSPGILNTKWISDQEIGANTVKDNREYPLLEDFDYTEPLTTNDFLLAAPKKPAVKEMLLLNFPDILIRTSAKGTFSFSIKTNTSSANNNTQPVVIQFLDTATGKVVFEIKKLINKDYQEINFKRAANKTYQLLVKHVNWLWISVTSTEWMALRNLPTYSSLGKLWFYIPPGKKYYYFSNTIETNPVFFDPAGKKITARKVNAEGVYQLPVNQSGSWWAIDETESKFLDFFTRPVLFFTHPGYSVIPLNDK